MDKTSLLNDIHSYAGAFDAAHESYLPPVTYNILKDSIGDLRTERTRPLLLADDRGEYLRVNNVIFRALNKYKMQT